MNDPTPLTKDTLLSECCGQSIGADDRFCPKCGWECRVKEEQPAQVPSKELVAALARFAQHGGQCAVELWEPEDEEDFDMPECNCGLHLLIAQANAYSANEPPAEPSSDELKRKLAAAGVFKGFEGLEGLLNASAFWEQQSYGTRLYYGDGITDYLHRGVLETAINILKQPASSQPPGVKGEDNANTAADRPSAITAGEAAASDGDSACPVLSPNSVERARVALRAIYDATAEDGLHENKALFNVAREALGYLTSTKEVR